MEVQVQFVCCASEHYCGCSLLRNLASRSLAGTRHINDWCDGHRHGKTRCFHDWRLIGNASNSAAGGQEIRLFEFRTGARAEKLHVAKTAARVAFFDATMARFWLESLEIGFLGLNDRFGAAFAY